MHQHHYFWDSPRSCAIYVLSFIWKYTFYLAVQLFIVCINVFVVSFILDSVIPFLCCVDRLDGFVPLDVSLESDLDMPVLLHSIGWMFC